MDKECPVDFIVVNENKVRLTALWVFVLVIISLLIIPLPIFIFLTLDFFLRAFNYGKFSLLNTFSNALVKRLKINNKPIDQSPKRFAAGIGIVLSVALVLLLLIGFLKTALILKIVFASFAFLESSLSFCAGCYVYTFLLYTKVIQ